MDIFSAYFDTLKRSQLPTDLIDEFSAAIKTPMIIYAVLYLAIAVFIAVAVGKADRTVCIVAGVINAASAIMAPIMVKSWAQLEFFKKIVGNSQAEVDKLADEYLSKALGNFAGYFGGYIVLILSLVFSIILCSKANKMGIKICGIFGIIIQIVKFMIFQPIDNFAMFDYANGCTLESQLSAMNLHYVSGLISLGLLLIPAIVHMIKKSNAVTVAEETTTVSSSDENTEA